MKLFVFPLNECVLHPGTSKPLNIFEPRYLKMVEDALAEQVPIALTFSDGAVPGVVAGFGVPELLEKRADGTLLIRLPGEGKARLKSVQVNVEPYLIAEGEEISENYEINAEQALAYMGLQRRLMKWMGEHIVDVATREHFVAALSGPQAALGAATAFLITDGDLQQLILEADDVNEKVGLLNGMLNYPTAT